MKKLKQNKSIDELKFKKKKVSKEDLEEEMLSSLSTGKKKFYSKFLAKSPDAAKDKPIKNLFKKKRQEAIEKGTLGEPKKEEYRIEMPFKKSKKEKIEMEEQEEISSYTDREEKLKERMAKQKVNIKTDYYNKNEEEESETYDSKYKSKRNKKKFINYSEDDNEEGEEDYYLSKMRNLKIRNKSTLQNNLSESYIKGLPTKIKIYKCVVWKNNDPTIDEETIKHILRRNNSLLLKHGGFIVKLPQTKTFKSKHSKI
jgi:hypothetical protein